MTKTLKALVTRAGSKYGYSTKSVHRSDKSRGTGLASVPPTTGLIRQRISWIRAISVEKA